MLSYVTPWQGMKWLWMGVRNAEVRGSIPLCSTNYFQWFTATGNGGCFGQVANTWTSFWSSAARRQPPLACSPQLSSRNAWSHEYPSGQKLGDCESIGTGFSQASSKRCLAELRQINTYKPLTRPYRTRDRRPPEAATTFRTQPASSQIAAS